MPKQLFRADKSGMHLVPTLSSVYTAFKMRATLSSEVVNTEMKYLKRIPPMRRNTERDITLCRSRRV